MNIPQPRDDGWTPSYLVELRQVADSIIPHIDTTAIHYLKQAEWRKMLQATENERKIFSYYASEWHASPAPSSTAWLNHRVAERCYEAAKVRFALGIVAERMAE